MKKGKIDSMIRWTKNERAGVSFQAYWNARSSKFAGREAFFRVWNLLWSQLSPAAVGLAQSGISNLPIETTLGASYDTGKPIPLQETI